MKKIFALILALTMLATLLPTLASAEEPYTYTKLTWQAGVLDDDCYMVNYWNNYYGVNFVVESLEQGSQDELIPLRLSDGNVPDIIKWTRSHLIDLVKEGLYGTFSVDTLKEYAPKIYEEMAALPGLMEYCSIDGELFTLGYAPLTSKYQNIAVWRRTWLEAIGEEVPTTLEDAERCWYAFAHEDPDGNGVDDTYGLSAGGMRQVNNAFGLYDTWILDENGQLVNWNVSPRRREALEKLAQYYADGVLDPEYITGENYGGYWAVSHAFTSGRIGFTQQGNFTHWPFTYLNTTSETFANGGAMYQNFPDEVTETDMPYLYAQPLEGPYGDCTYGVSSYETICGFSKALIEDEERFGRLLEIAQDLGGYNDIETYIQSRYGEKGVHWDYDEDGFPVSYPEYDSVAGRVAIGGLITFQIAMSEAADASSYDREDQAAYARLMQDVDYKTSIQYVQNKLPSQGDYKAELDKMASEVFTDIITGAKPIEAFDEFVKQWYANGGQILTDEANALYNPNN